MAWMSAFEVVICTEIFIQQTVMADINPILGLFDSSCRVSVVDSSRHGRHSTDGLIHNVFNGRQ